MAWTAPRTWTAGDALTDSLMNTQLRDNLSALKTPPFQQDKSSTTVDITSTSFVDLDADFEVSITPSIIEGTCILLVMANFSVRCSATSSPQVITFDLLVGGTSVSGGAGIQFAKGEVDTGLPVGICYPVAGVTPGAKTVKLRAKVDGGTARLRYGSHQSHFSVVEI